MKFTSAATSTSCQDPNSYKKPKTKRSLNDPDRINMIRTHRALQSTFGKSVHMFASKPSKEMKPKFGEKIPKHLKVIKLGEMDPELDWVFEKRVLYLTLIEDPMTGFTPIHSIAEDEDGNSIRLFVHEVPHNKKMLDLLCYGRQLAIVHPYMRIALDGRNGIRVDDPKNIVLLGKKSQMCRYCGVQDALIKCAECKTAAYCSRECQTLDGKVLGHKCMSKKLNEEEGNYGIFNICVLLFIAWFFGWLFGF